MLVILCDGSSKGNPGPSSIGVVIWKRISGTSSARRVSPEATVRRDIGIATNNDAEWQAVIEAGCYVKKNAKHGEDVFIYTDSLLVVSQANGEWKVRQDTMKQYRSAYLKLVAGFRVKLAWLPRQLTYLADKVAV